MLKAALGAIGFLTIIPVGHNCPESELRKSPAFFPLAGALEGLLYIGLLYVLSRYFGAGISAGVLMAAHLVFTGGFHADGLADTFDAIAARADRQRKLEIMRDGTSGPIGVSALFMAMLLKFLFLEAAVGSVFRNAMVFMMPVSSRWSMTVSLFHARPARAEGLGNFMISGTRLIHAVAATLVALGLALLAYKLYAAAWVLAALLGLYAFTLVMVYVFSKNFGGLTGDNLGAISELSEIAFLALAVICSRYIS
jgi:adenosylcobinamide-GDP ribazoletransferase